MKQVVSGQVKSNLLDLSRKIGFPSQPNKCLDQYASRFTGEDQELTTGVANTLQLQDTKRPA